MNDNNLRNILFSVARGKPNRSDVSALIRVCHDMARAYLHAKTNSGKFDPSRFGLTISDFAFDAIAELFRRDASGTFLALKAFIQRLPTPADLSEAAAENELRRIVFSSVNQRIFREYGSYDPSLSRIIRNIKLAVRRHPAAASCERFNELMIVPKETTDFLESHPAISPEILSPELNRRMPQKPSLKDMLTVLVEILNDQSTYRRMISVVEAAILFRTEYALGYAAELTPQTEEGLSVSELSRFIDQVVLSLEQRHSDFYVSRGKLNADEYSAHISAVRQILTSEFVSWDGDAKTYYQIMQERISSLTPDEYKTKHRMILEYLAKTARKELATLVRKEL